MDVSIKEVGDVIMVGRVGTDTEESVTVETIDNDVMSYTSSDLESEDVETAETVETDVELDKLYSQEPIVTAGNTPLISACSQNAPTFIATSLLPKPVIPGQDVWDIGPPVGILENQNFLSSLQQIGVDTVFSKCGGGNVDIKGDIPNPINVVSPWLNSTILPNLERRPLPDFKAPSDEYMKPRIVEGTDKSHTDKIYVATAVYKDNGARIDFKQLQLQKPQEPQKLFNPPPPPIATSIPTYWGTNPNSTIAQDNFIAKQEFLSSIQQIGVPTRSVNLLDIRKNPLEKKMEEKITNFDAYQWTTPTNTSPLDNVWYPGKPAANPPPPPPTPTPPLFVNRKTSDIHTDHNLMYINRNVTSMAHKIPFQELDKSYCLEPSKVNPDISTSGVEPAYCYTSLGYDELYKPEEEEKKETSTEKTVPIVWDNEKTEETEEINAECPQLDTISEDEDEDEDKLPKAQEFVNLSNPLIIRYLSIKKGTVNWSNISKSPKISEQLLGVFYDDLDHPILYSNPSFPKFIDYLELIDKMDWELYSRYMIIMSSRDLLQDYKEKLIWSQISKNSTFNWSVIMNLLDQDLDYSKLIDWSAVSERVETLGLKDLEERYINFLKLTDSQVVSLVEQIGLVDEEDTIGDLRGPEDIINWFF